MKKCSYCGAEYPDDTVVCAVDQTSLQSGVSTQNSDSEVKSSRHQHIGPAGYWLIFSGIPTAIAAILFVATERSLDRIVGENALPYVLFFVPVLIIMVSRVLYDRFPKRLVIPLGIMGWMVNFATLFWFYQTVGGRR
jgi:hypothetical protein